LVDNYILTDSNLLEENLTSIFDILLPQKLNLEVPFQISIFTTLKTSDQKNDINSAERQKQIANLIELLRPELWFKLSIFKVSKDKFHDRTLITNNYYVSCGGGFDLFKQHRPTKMTSINIVYPVFSNSILWTPVAYSNFINEVSIVYNKATSFSKEFLTGFFRGDKQNRLMVC
jgi:hypothetical protein